MTTSDLLRVQKHISEGQWRADVRATTWARNVVADALGLDASEKSQREKIKKLLDVWIKNRALKIAVRPDGKSMPKNFIEVGQ